MEFYYAGEKNKLLKKVKEISSSKKKRGKASEWGGKNISLVLSQDWILCEKEPHKSRGEGGGIGKDLAGKKKYQFKIQSYLNPQRPKGGIDLT